MRFLVMVNGAYGDLGWYRRRTGRFQRVICADGGAGTARRLGLVPDWVVGDMDSVRREDLQALEQAGAKLCIYPAEKDPTDTMLALELAQREGAREVVIWGGTGSRLDHTLSNLFNASRLTAAGIRVRFEGPELTIYLVNNQLELPGRVGDTVSVIVLGDLATGVTEEGFRYPLKNATLEGTRQYAVSNVITAPHPRIRVAGGILAVFHYRELPDSV